jgi:hypothetical protein
LVANFFDGVAKNEAKAVEWSPDNGSHCGGSFSKMDDVSIEVQLQDPFGMDKTLRF